MQALGHIIPDSEVFIGLSVNLGLLIVHNNKNEIKESPGDWLVITDMQMSWSDDDYDIDIDAGYGVLDEMHRLRLSCPAIIISSSKVNDADAQACYNSYVGAIKYDSSVDLQQPLKEILRSVL